MARPRKQIKRTEVIRVRYTPMERRLLNGYASRYGVSVAGFIRDKTLNHEMRQRLTLEEVQILRSLIGMANNLNTLVRKLHLGDFDLHGIDRILGEIHIVIRKMR